MAGKDYPYNDDLLREERWQAQAREEYPDIAEALIFPELITKFNEADEIANRFKRKTHGRGMWAVGMVLAALLAASASPLSEQKLVQPWPNVIAGLAAAAGVLGTVLAVMNRLDRRWLQHRMVTESLRQLHFRLLIALAPEVLEAGRSNDWSGFKARRKIALAEFDQDVIQRMPDVFGNICKGQEPMGGGRINPLLDPSTFRAAPGPMLWKAYRKLRIHRQNQFAEHKLKDDWALFSSFPLVQAKTLGVIGVLCIMLLLVLHVAAALAPAFSEWIAEGAGQWLHLAAVWTAILALAIRVVEEGLKPRAEVDRYRNYQLATRRILTRFDAAPADDFAARIRAAQALERASFDEMTAFLRTNAEARFFI